MHTLTHLKTTALLIACIGLSISNGTAQDIKPELPKIPEAVFNVQDFGLKADGETDDSAAIQKAIDKAAEQGGGTVRFSKGNILSGPLKMKNNIRLQIDKDVVITLLPLARYPGGTNNPEDFIGGSNLHDVAISGEGTIEGQGSDWWKIFRETRNSKSKDTATKEILRPRMIGLDDCTRVMIEGVTLRNSPKFHIAVRGKELTVSKVTVRAPSSKDPVNPSHNTDACNLSGKNILVENCDISTGDDNFTCGKNTSNVLIRNNKYGTGHGLSIGSYTQGSISNFTVRDCTFDGTENGIRIKSNRKRGGKLSGITYENLKMTNVETPILIYTTYDDKDKKFRDLTKLTPEVAATYPSAPLCETTPQFEDITFRNITATTIPNERAGLAWGLPEAPIGRLTLENVTITADRPFGFYFVKEVILKNVKITTPDGENKFVETNSKITITK